MTTTEEIMNAVTAMDDRAKNFVAAIASAVLQTQQSNENAGEEENQKKKAA